MAILREGQLLNTIYLDIFSSRVQVDFHTFVLLLLASGSEMANLEYRETGCPVITFPFRINPLVFLEPELRILADEYSLQTSHDARWPLKCCTQCTVLLQACTR